MKESFSSFLAKTVWDDSNPLLARNLKKRDQKLLSSSSSSFSSSLVELGKTAQAPPGGDEYPMNYLNPPLSSETTEITLFISAYNRDNLEILDDLRQSMSNIKSQLMKPIQENH